MDLAKTHGSQVLKAQEYDPNICSFVHNRLNRAELIATSGQPLLNKTAFEFDDLPIKVFANDCYLRTMMFRELPETFSLNRIDNIVGLRSAGNITIAGRVYQLGTPTGSIHAQVFQRPAFANMLDAINLGENESVHFYRNGLAYYLFRPEMDRAERILRQAAAFLHQL
jgi:hypothetical protein